MLGYLTAIQAGINGSVGVLWERDIGSKVRRAAGCLPKAAARRNTPDGGSLQPRSTRQKQQQQQG